MGLILIGEEEVRPCQNLDLVPFAGDPGYVFKALSWERERNTLAIFDYFLIFVTPLAGQ